MALVTFLVTLTLILFGVLPAHPLVCYCTWSICLKFDVGQAGERAIGLSLSLVFGVGFYAVVLEASLC